MNSKITTILLPYIILYMGFIVMSPVLAYLGLRGVYSYLIALAICIILYLFKFISLKKWFLFFALLVLLSSSATAIYWGDIRFIFANFFLIVALFVLQASNSEVLDKFIDFSSILILFILFGAVIGFVLALNGLSPLYEFPNLDGRPNFFYYTTLTNAVFGYIIRPSGIYDEPGALSLYVCAIAAIRHLSGKDSKLTWSMLLLGFVTLSLAHLIYVFCHFIAERFTKKNILMFSYFVALVVAMFLFTELDNILSDRLFQRLLISEETGSIEGDNRSYMLFNAIMLISYDYRIFLFGLDPVCRFEYLVCRELFPPIGENPLMPILTNGFFVSWPFYIALISLLLSPLLSRKFFVTFGFGILLIQRPEMLILSGAMISSVILLYLFSKYPARKRIL